MAKVRIGINGFGRIGRGVVRAWAREPEAFDLALINDLTDAATLGHLLKHDSVHGRFPGTVEINDGALVINGDAVKISSVKNPAEIDWKGEGAEVVVESTGLFVDREKAAKHLEGGAKKVVISAPGKKVDGTFCIGVNEKSFDPKKHDIISNASCTTNCLAQVAKVLHDEFEITSGMMTTIHAYTNDQRILDLPHKDLRRARAAGLSMIPTSTGAARALKEVIPDLEGKLDGMAIRVPTANVSLVDLVAKVKKPVTTDSVNDAFRKAAAAPGMSDVLAASDEPLVSIDYNGDPHSATVDLLSTNVIGDTVKVLAWYDNEAGYSQRLFDLAKLVASKL